MTTLFDENRLEEQIDSKVKTIVKNEIPKKSSHRATVVRKDSEGTWWVRIDGNDSDTPVLVNKVDMSVGDVVTVVIDDHVTIADGNITSPPMSAYNSQAYVDRLVAENIKAVAADIGYLKADTAKIGYAQIEDADITNARIQNLTYEVTNIVRTVNADHAIVNSLDTNYARINGANINTLESQEAWLNKVMVQTGMIVSEGDVFYLEAIHVNAESIDAGELVADRIALRGTDGLYYALNVDAMGAATVAALDYDEYPILAGDNPSELGLYELVDDEYVATSDIVPVSGKVYYRSWQDDLRRSLHADVITAGSITADKITTQDIVGSGGWINLRNGTFQYVNAISGQGISWDGTNLHISGSVTVGGLPVDISEAAGAAMDTLIYKVSYVYDEDENTHEKVSATFTAHLYRGAEDIKASYPENCFTWYFKSENWVQGEPMIPLVSNGDYTCTVDIADVGYGATIVGRFEPPNDAIALTDDDDTLTDDDDTPISVRTPSGDYVRISELEVETTIFDTDKMLLVTSEGEKLATVATLKQVFGTSSYEDLDDLPSIEGVTLINDKSFPDLGIFKTDSQGYDVPDDYTLSTMDINALWANAVPIGA